MKPTLLFVFILFSYFSLAQSPGGIQANNTLWLRSDVGVASAANIVSGWNDQSGANVTGNFTVQALAGTANVQAGPSLLEPGINFNPYLRFNGVNHSLSSLNIFPGTSLVDNSHVTVFQVVNVKSGIVWLKWETDQLGSTARLGFENAGGRIRFDFPSAVPASAGQNVGITNVLNKHTLSTCYVDGNTSVNRLNGAADNSMPIPAPGNFAAVSDKLVIGNENLLNLPAEVDLAELVIYKSALTASERNKVESYLAVKYGFTLDQSAANGNDYTSSNGTVIWDRASNTGNAANITGIGRDDGSALNQKQSKSVNTTGLLTIYNGNGYTAGAFPATNAVNTNTFSADQSFLLIGDNGAATTTDICILNGKGKRIQRVWKVSKTGSVGAVNISADQASLPSTVKYLIVSPDPNFPQGNTIFYPLSVAGNLLYKDVNFSHNDYFSFATDTLVVSMTPTNPTCTNPNGGGVVTVVSGNSQAPQYTWTPSGQTTANLVNVAAGTYTLTIAQGACLYDQQVTLTTPAVLSPPYALDTLICKGGQATLHVDNPQAGITYNWYDAVTGGNLLGTGTTFTTPANLTSDQIYYLEASNGTCSSVRAIISVNITTVIDAIFFGGSTCSGSNFTFTINNVNPGYTYEWYNTPTGGTPLATGTSYTTNALITTTTFYVLAINGTCPGNRTPAFVDITTVPPPSLSATNVCSGNTAQLEVITPVTGLTYQWYDQPTAVTPLGTGTIFTTPVITSQTVFYVSANDGTCTSLYSSSTVGLIQPLDSPRVTVGLVTSGSITFNWTAVAGATGYEISVDGGAFFSPGNGPSVLSYTVNGLANEQTVHITVVPLGTQDRCGNGLPGHASATTFGQGFYVPTAFTPNGDNLNDIFKPLLPGGALLDYFAIFNRWGQQIYSTNKAGEGWDGKWKEKQQPGGTYVWVCQYRMGAHPIIEKGTVTLLF